MNCTASRQGRLAVLIAFALPISKYKNADMGLGTKNRQKQTAELCKQHLRERNLGKLALVEEFIHELEGTGKDHDVTRWEKFTDIKGINEEMLKRLDSAFEKWLNP